MTTVIVTPEEFCSDRIELSAASFHHLFRVRRLRTGDALRVVDGAGRARGGVVERIERQRAQLTLGNPLSANEPKLAVELLVAAPRPQRASWLVEKATEIGVVAIRFLRTERSPRSYGSSTVARLGRAARAAVEQCDRSLVPEVTAGHTLQESLETLESFDACFLLHPTGPRLADGELLRIPRRATRVGMAIGPEGGWSEREASRFQQSGCQPVGLGERILRVETAAVVGAAALLVTGSVDTPEDPSVGYDANQIR